MCVRVCLLMCIQTNIYTVYVFVFQNPKEVALGWKMKVCRIEMNKLRYTPDILKVYFKEFLFVGTRNERPYGIPFLDYQYNSRIA